MLEGKVDFLFQKREVVSLLTVGSSSKYRCSSTGRASGAAEHPGSTRETPGKAARGSLGPGFLSDLRTLCLLWPSLGPPMLTLAFDSRWALSGQKLRCGASVSCEFPRNQVTRL